MPNESTPTTDTSTESNAAVHPEDAAMAFLESLGETKPPQGETTPDAKDKPQGKPEAKPGEKKPEPKDDAKQRRDAATLLEKANARSAYADRQISKLENERKAFDTERDSFVATTKSLTSIDAIVKHLAKSTGRSEDDYWTEFIEHVQNRGKEKPADTAAMREVKRLREELEQERAEKTKSKSQAEEERQAQLEAKQKSSWQDTVIAHLSDDDGAERWPLLSSTVAPEILRATALTVVENHYARTNTVATIEQVLDALEQLQASKVKPTGTPAEKHTNGVVNAAAPKASQVRVPSNDDSATPITDTRDLSPQEREELAVTKLKALLG